MTPPKLPVVKVCIMCGVEFTTPAVRKVTCGPECAHERHKQIAREHAQRKFVPSTKRLSLPPKDCDWCGEFFKPYTSAHRYCCKTCQQRAVDAQRDRHKAVRRCKRCQSTDLRDRQLVCDECRIDKRNRQDQETRRRLRKYGLTADRYAELLESQSHRCAVCRSADPGPKGTWAIDHDHACCSGVESCGRCVRGLLCSGCNLMLGQAGDDPDRLLAGADYVARHRQLRLIA